MQEAKQNGLIDFIVSRVTKNLMLRYFSRVSVRADLEVFQNPEGLPTIYYANHTARWDHVLGLYISQKLWKQESYVTVNKGMLEHYVFLRYTGGFSIDNTNPLDTAQTFKYIQNLLNQNPQRAVWFFPQGIVRRNDIRPLGFQPGIGQLVRLLDKVRLVPVVFRYEFGLDTKAEGFISFGKPLIMGKHLRQPTRTIVENLEATLTDELDRLKQDVVAGDTAEFIPALQSKGLLLTRAYSVSSRLYRRLLNK